MTRTPLFLPCSASIDENQIPRATIDLLNRNNANSDFSGNEQDTWEDDLNERQHHSNGAKERAGSNFDTNDNFDDEYDEEDTQDEEESDENGFIRRRRKRSVQSDLNAEIEYIWFLNGELLVNSSQRNVTGFRLMNNGTLKIQQIASSAGTYRCLAREVKHNMGGIISREVIVRTAGKLHLKIF